MNKKMISKRIVVTLLAVAVVFFAYLLWPRSLGRYTADCEKIRVYYMEDGIREELVSGETTEAGDTESNVENAGADIETYLESENVEYTSGQPEFDVILEILDNYTVHKTLRGLALSVTGETPSLEGNEDGYYLNIYLYDADGNCAEILSGGTGEIIVDGELCRMGYFGNEKNRTFMEEISGI